MKIEYKNGNCLLGPEVYVAHCVNAQGAFGSGVARQIRNWHPQAYEDYMSVYSSKGLKLGDVFETLGKSKNVIHIVGQENYGYDGKLYLNYEALAKGFMQINENMRNKHGSRVIEAVAFPQIGCGLAGGDWDIVSEKLERYSTHFQPVVYIYE